jgi:hypothetical protein
MAAPCFLSHIGVSIPFLLVTFVSIQWHDILTLLRTVLFTLIPLRIHFVLPPPPPVALLPFLTVLLCSPVEFKP